VEEGELGVVKSPKVFLLAAYLMSLVLTIGIAVTIGDNSRRREYCKMSDNGCCIKSNNEKIKLIDDYELCRPSPDKISTSSSPTKGGGEPLNFSSNILLVYRLDEMRRMLNTNLTLAMICLGYW